MRGAVIVGTGMLNWIGPGLALALLGLSGCAATMPGTDADASCTPSLGSHLCGSGDTGRSSGLDDPSLSQQNTGGRTGTGH